MSLKDEVHLKMGESWLLLGSRSALYSEVVPLPFGPRRGGSPCSLVLSSLYLGLQERVSKGRDLRVSTTYNWLKITD